MASHRVPEELILPAATRLADEVGSRRPDDEQRLIAAYTERILGVVAFLGYGVEYLAAGRLHRIGEDPGITPDYLYRQVPNLPFCVSDAALLMDDVRYSDVRERLRTVATDPIAVVVTYSEAIANSGDQLEGAPGDSMNVACVRFLSTCLEPLLPPVDMQV